MAQKFTRVPSDTFEKLQLNAGILVKTFTPATGVIGDILGATTGGIQFNSNPTFTDFGADIDNVPNNMKELKHLDQFDPQMSGTFLTCTPALAKSLVGAADIDSQDTTKIVPRAELLASDFTDLWWIGDYSDINTGDSAGFLAIHLLNALNTSGFQIQSTKNEKGKLSFEYHGHYSLASQDTVPFEIYVKSGTETVKPMIALNTHYVEMLSTDTFQLEWTKAPSTASVVFSAGSSSVATVGESTGLISGAGAGNTIITATLTSGGVTVTDTCTVVVTAAEA